jgi:hypothetical protein
MKREDMTCVNCLNFDPNAKRLYRDTAKPRCKFHPYPQTFCEDGDIPFDPASHWCAQGKWCDSMPGTTPTYLYWGMSEEDGYRGTGGVLGDDDA